MARNVSGAQRCLLPEDELIVNQIGPITRPVPSARDVDELKDMVTFLARRYRPGHGDDAGDVPDPRDANTGLLQSLWNTMRSMVGDATFDLQRRCGDRRRHLRGRICETCGYSDNLYLQELQRILKRRRR